MSGAVVGAGPFYSITILRYFGESAMRAAWFAPVILALATLVGGSTAFAQSPVDAAQSNPPAA